MMKSLPLALLLLAAAEPAQAHAFLDTADPPVGSTVAAAPKAVSLSFTQAVEPSFSTIEVADAAGHRVDQGDPHTVPDDPAVLVVTLKPLAAGDYRVTWHVTSVDTHKTQGSFGFSVGP